MKFSLSRTRAVPLLIAGCGILGLIFRLLYTGTGTDGKGLLLPWHPAWIGVCVVTVAAAAILVMGVLPIRAATAHRAAFPRSIPGAAGCALAAVSAVSAAVTHFRSGAPVAASKLAPALFYMQGGLILLAAVSFLLVALCRLRGRKPSFLLHAAISIYFAIQMLVLYQTCSFDPQIQTYVFQLFACIALTMTAYQLAAFDMGKGSHRKLWTWALAAVYLCCLSAASGLFFITGGIWAFTNLSTLRRPRQQKAEQTEESTNME